MLWILYKIPPDMGKINLIGGFMESRVETILNNQQENIVLKNCILGPGPAVYGPPVIGRIVQKALFGSL